MQYQRNTANIHLLMNIGSISLILHPVTVDSGGDQVSYSTPSLVLPNWQ